MCNLGSITQTETSKETSAMKGKEPQTGLGAIVENVKSDLSIGLSTIGQSKEKRAETMKDAGYSDAAIKDYEDRTEASAAKHKEIQDRLRQNKKKREKREEREKTQKVAADAAADDAAADVDTTPMPPAAPSSTAQPEAGSAEEAVVKEAEDKKGFAGTIETTPAGLLAPPKTRKKRSLMGGLIT